MGCNTSKESVQPVEGEEKGEEQPNQEENEENKENSSKPPSAETIKATTPAGDSAKSAARLSNHLENSVPTPTPTPTPATPVTALSEKSPVLKSQESEANCTATDPVNQVEEEAAATKIQAVFRGHQTRRTMKQSDGKQQQPAQEPEPTREQLEAEFRADDAELCKAATTIQNSFRNHLKSKQGEGAKEEGSASNKENKDEEEELDIDLSDPNLNKAATKIQASFRGHMVRKDHEGSAPPENH